VCGNADWNHTVQDLHLHTFMKMAIIFMSSMKDGKSLEHLYNYSLFKNGSFLVC